MKHPSQNAKRWMDQAEHDLQSARNNLEKVAFYSDACFMSEQAAQKALKAYLLFKGERYITIHSVQELANLCGQYDRAFEKVVEYGMVLDRYYIPTRYPDALAPPAVPYKSYTNEDAVQALRYAEKILQLVRNKIK